MEEAQERTGRRPLFKILDASITILAGVSALLLLLPDVDIPIGRDHIIRLAGATNPILVGLVLLVIVRIFYPTARPRVLRWIENLRMRSGLVWRPMPALLLTGFLVNTFYNFPGFIGGDGLCYYAYLRSAALQGDLDFTDEFGDYSFGTPGLPDPRLKTATGLVGNPFSIGPAILWTPFFALGHGIALLRGLAVDGYSQPYVDSVVLGTQLYALLGLILCVATIRLLVPGSAATFAVIGLWIASPLTEYFRHEGSMSHALSVFAVSLFVYLFVRAAGKRSPVGWLALGAAGGLVFLVRWQDATYCLLPLVDLLRGKKLRDAIADGYLYSAACFLVALPQLFVFKLIYGAWFVIPQGKEFIGVVPAYLWQVLFSSNHGLLSWHPIVALCLSGIVLGIWKRLPHFRLLFAGFLMQLVVNTSIGQWWAGHAFGGRRFLGCFVLFAAGLAGLLQTRMLSGWRGVSVVAAFAGLNYVLWLAWVNHLIPNEGPFTIHQAATALLGEAVRFDVPPKSLAILAMVLFLVGSASRAKPASQVQEPSARPQ